MFFRSQVSVCSLVVCLACLSSLLLGADPPTEIAQHAAWENRIEAALDAQGEWDFFDAPLKDVCDEIQEKLGIDVVLDLKALEDYGIDSTTPMTLAFKGISNRSFLRLMLRDLELTYTLRNGALWITNWEEAESQLITKVYPVGDLLVRDSTLVESPRDYDSLIETITHTIAPDTWDEVGGPGAVEGIYNAIVVSQTTDIHEQIAELLTICRMIIKRDKADDGTQKTVYLLGEREVSAAIRRALDRPITAEFKDAALRDVVEVLSKTVEIPIVIDTLALEDFGIDTSIPINGQFKDTLLQFVLRRILSEQELVYIIRDEVLVITTPEEGESALVIGLYPVRDLVQTGDEPIIDSLGGTNFDFDTLIATIESTVAPDSWDTVGGPGAIDVFLPVPTLVLAQMQDVHDEIGALLTKLRRAKELEAERVGDAAEPAADVHVLRSYPINVESLEPDDVAKLVVRATDPGTWNDADGTFVQGLGKALVVKHKVSVHRRVQRLLAELRVQSWSAGPSGVGFRCGLQVGDASGNNNAKATGAPAVEPSPRGGGGGFF